MCPPRGPRRRRRCASPGSAGCRSCRLLSVGHHSITANTTDRVDIPCRGTACENRLVTRVLTWNVWGRNGSWEARQGAIAAVLRAEAADIVCLQESWVMSDGTSLTGAL